MNTLRFIICTAAIVIHMGCATLFKPPQDDPEARQMIETALHHNDELSRYKALANVLVESGGRKISGRVALAAAVPDRMRLEWLSSIGQPLTRLVGDGHYISISSHGETGIRRVPQTPKALETLIRLPIGFAELQSLITGCLKLPDFVSANIFARDDQLVTIALKNRWHRIVATVGIGPLEGRINRFELFNRDEAPVYTIHWNQWQQAGNYEVPKNAVLSTRSGHQLALSKIRFWPDVELPLSTFELVSPDETP
jgi:hypothetical protein